MEFLLEALDEIAAEIFGSVAHLLNLDLDILFVDTTSTYWELDIADELVDLAEVVDDDGSRPVEQAKREFGHSKDHRTDLPQVVIAMAVTRDGVPVRCWTFSGDTGDTSIIRTVKHDLAGWNMRRMVWVADRGFASAANRAYLTRGGGHYIHAEKLRHTNGEAAAALARPGRYRTVAGNLRVKEVAVAPGGNGDGDDGAPGPALAGALVIQPPGQRPAVAVDLVPAHMEPLFVGKTAVGGAHAADLLRRGMRVPSEAGGGAQARRAVPAAVGGRPRGGASRPSRRSRPADAPAAPSPPRRAGARRAGPTENAARRRR